MFAALLLALMGCSNDPEPVQVTPPPVQHMVRGPSGTPDWIVDCQGSGDFTTISDAIDAASDHQWIEVLACTYNETLNYDGKSLWISSRDGSGMTVIDFGGAGQGVDVDKGEGIGTALVGFTLRNWAIDLDLASLYLRDIHFRSNYGQYVIRSISGDLRVDDIDIDDSNTPTSAAIYGDKGLVMVVRSTLTCGTNRGVRADHGSFMIDWSEINCGANGDEAFETEHGVGRIQRTALAGRIEIVSPRPGCGGKPVRGRPPRRHRPVRQHHHRRRHHRRVRHLRDAQLDHGGQHHVHHDRWGRDHREQRLRRYGQLRHRRRHLPGECAEQRLLGPVRSM